MASPGPADSGGVPAAPYVVTDREQAFIEGVLTPKFVEIGNAFDGEVDKLRLRWEKELASEFASIRGELKTEVAQICEMMRSHLAALRNELITRTDDKLTTFHKSSAPSIPSLEPTVLTDVCFSGDPAQLTSFLYAIHVALALHDARFASNDRCFKWIARHFRPATSPAADWWISLVAENTSMFDRSIPEGQTASFPFRLEKLKTVSSFLDELVTTFSDPFADQKALKALQGFEMGKLGIQQFNAKFNALSYCVKGLNKAVLINYYQRALSDRVRRQALSRQDWAPCRTVKECQAVTLLASRQLDDLSSTHRPVALTGHAGAMVPVPQDPTAMDVDVHAAGACMVRSPVPSIVSFNFYRELCHQRGLCWRCLKGYNEAHRARKADPSSLSSCPNPPVDSVQMDRFATQCQSQPLPPPMHQVAVASHLSPVPTVLSDHPGSLLSPVGGQPFYHSPPHLAYPPPMAYHPYPPYSVPPPVSLLPSSPYDTPRSPLPVVNPPSPQPGPAASAPTTVS